MNKNTLKAINKRLERGLKAFWIGDNCYRVNEFNVLLRYNYRLSSVAIIEGSVENGKLNTENIFGTESPNRIF